MKTESEIINEKILSLNNIESIEKILDTLFESEFEMRSMIFSNNEKNNPIYDEDDHENTMLKPDLEFYLNNFNWAKWINDKKFDNEIKELIESYLLNLKILKDIMESNIISLKIKTSDNYKDYFKTNAHNILDNKPHDFNNLNKDLEDKKNYEDLSEVCEKNPYMILLKTYEYYLDIIKVLEKNIKKRVWLVAEQSIFISAGLGLNVSTFLSLKEWEDSILIHQLTDSNIL